MLVRRAPVAAATIMSLLLLSLLSSNAGSAVASVSAGWRCVPAVVALPLPVGESNGDVLSATAREAVGYVADDAQHQHVAVWLRSGATWAVHDLGDLGVTEPHSGLSATGVNDRGLVSIGVNTDVMGAWVYAHGEVHQLIDFAGGTNAYARAVNASGEIVGEALDADGNDFAAIWRTWSSPPIKLSPATGYDGSFAQGIDERGDVVGGSFSNGTLPSVAVRWTPTGHPTVLAGLGGDAQAFDAVGPRRVVGVANTADGPHAVVWDRRSLAVDLGLFPGAEFSRAIGVDSDGDVVGFEGTNPPPPAIPVRHVLFWTGHGPVRSLLPLSLNWADGAYSHAADNNGDVFGASAAATEALPRPTEWTCADAQSFVPPVVGSDPTPSAMPHVVGLRAKSTTTRSR